MRSRLKTLGSALAVALALSAAGAVAAQAATEHTFTSDSVSDYTELHGVSHTESFVIQIGGPEGPAVACNSFTLEGEETGSERDTITLTQTLAECEGFLGELEVITNHCALIFDSDTTSGPNEDHASVTQECVEGQTIELVEPGVCKIGIGPQTHADGVTYTNIEKNGHDAITVDMTTTGLDYHKISGSFCFLLPGGGTGSDGTINGNFVLTGYEGDGSHVSGTAKTTPALDKIEQINLAMITP